MFVSRQSRIRCVLWSGVALLATSSIAGCASSPATSGPPMLRPGETVLYIYRPRTYSISVLSAIFSVDGKRVAKLENNDFVAIPVAVGKHTVTHEWKAGLLEEGGLEGQPVSTIISATAGRATYIRLDSGAAWAPSREASPNIAIRTKYAWKISEVPAAQAQAEIADTRQVRAEAQ